MLNSPYIQPVKKRNLGLYNDEGIMRKLAAIMFTDIVGYTAHMARDEQGALKLLQESREVLQPLIKAHGGQWLKEMGDGTLSSFDSATEAVTCALNIQRSLAESGSFKLRIGIHVGDVIFEGGDVLGDGVNVASRIENLARPGGICVSEQVYDSIRNKPEIGAVFLGKKQLKNINRPVKVFALTGEGLPPPGPKSRPVKESLPPARRILRRWGLLVPTALLAGLIGYVAISQREPLNGGITSIAVLPLENYTGDPDQNYFVEGMHDAIISNLAQIKALKVISRTSVMQYRGSEKPIPKIARELGVDAIVEGSVTKAADSVRITAQLIHGRTDEHWWAGSYDRDLRHVLSLQNEVARAIAEQIKIAITSVEEARLASARTVNPEAYEAYLKGRHHWNKRTPDGLNQSLAYFTQAIELDPNSALGYSGLADAYNMIGSYSYYPPSDMLPKAKEAALQALAIDSIRAEAHASLAAVQLNYDWDWDAAEESFRTAIELNPGYAIAHHWYSQYLIAMGRTDESFRAMERALQLDPLNLEINSTLARKLYFTRQYDEAIKQCLKTLEIDDPFFLTHTYLGLSYAHKGMFEEAISSLQTAVALSGENPLVICALGYVYGIAGRDKDAQSILEELLAAARARYVPAVSIAAVYMGLGDKDSVFEWLEKAYQERHHYLVFFKVEPMVDSLRSDPRFTALLEEMGLD